MKKMFLFSLLSLFVMSLTCGFSSTAEAAQQRVGDLSQVKTMEIDRGLTKVGKNCVECHQKEEPGIVSDWKNSRHGHVGVSCVDCHRVPKDSPAATQHEDLVGTDVYISALVSPNVCGRCHAQEQEQFNKSGHIRAYTQQLPKKNLHALVQVHEGRNHPKFKNAPGITGCVQCHGTEIKLDKKGRPIASTWPNAGMGNVYPDGGVGNCAACHTRHKFDIAEARKPQACASCHLGPDHPDIEIFENSKHGHIFITEGASWKYDSAPDAWEPGDYRAPTCAVCHMSGIGELKTSHNVNERLYWNLWAKESKVRNSNDVLSPLLGYGQKGRDNMKTVCSSCHTKLHTDNYFVQGDQAVMLYNEAYYKPATKMLKTLKAKGLLKANPWTDKFQKVYYHLWHHEGRRARQGAMMGAPDYAHWHGFFELQIDMYELEEMYEKRMKSGKIEH